MTPTQITLKQIYIFIILMSLGYFFRKKQLLSKTGLQGIATLLSKLFMPITVFYVIYDSGADLKQFMEHNTFLLLSLVLMLALLQLGKLVAKLVKADHNQAVPLTLYFTFNNNNFFGLPIITSLFSSVASKINFSQFLIIDSVLLWTLGAYLCNQKQTKTSFFKQLKNSLNPMTWALLIGIVMLSFKLTLPEIINQALTGFKVSSGTVAMFYIGCLLADTDYHGILKDKGLLVLIGLKMLLIPFLIIIFGPLVLSAESSLILALLISLPGKILVSIMVGDYGLDHYYAAKLVFATTLMALPIIPLLTWLATSR